MVRRRLLVFRYSNKFVLDSEYKFDVKYLTVGSLDDIKTYITIEGVSGCMNQYLEVTKKEEYILRKVTYLFSKTKQIRKNEIKFLDDTYDFKHSTILCCYKDELPKGLKVSIFKEDNIKYEKIDPMKEKVDRFSYYLAMYFYDGKKLYCGSFNPIRSNYVTANEIKRIGTLNAYKSLAIRKEIKFEDC